MLLYYSNCGRRRFLVVTVVFLVAGSSVSYPTQKPPQKCQGRPLILPKGNNRDWERDRLLGCLPGLTFRTRNPI